ncbi:MAG: DNA polymerase III subunit delta' [Desulfovermiculus sp.]|nr:DNA polymerase III subunit delta' [Desulfovermiculus sp.]
MTEVIPEQLPASLARPEGQGRVVSLLHRLGHHPPQVLLLEGATPRDRLVMGLYWAALLNCPGSDPPCLGCSVCRQIQGLAFRDLHVFSGMEEAIKIDGVRHIRAGMGQRPDHGRMRVILFHQAQELTPSAANSLLKAMEEPLPGNVFVLLAPLRSWLLPTLVSRSQVLTLSRSSDRRSDHEQVGEWQKRLTGFWRTGRGLFEHTAKKGEVSRTLVQEIVTACQQALGEAMQGEEDGEMSQLMVQSLDVQGLTTLDRVLHKAHQALNLQTTPALVLDWVGVQGWSLVGGSNAFQ